MVKAISPGDSVYEEESEETKEIYIDNALAYFNGMIGSGSWHYISDFDHNYKIGHRYIKINYRQLPYNITKGINGAVERLNEAGWVAKITNSYCGRGPFTSLEVYHKSFINNPPSFTQE